MTQRLTRITTKKGDAGETSIATGERLSKASLRVEAIGDVDELNAVLGLLKVSLGSIDHRHSEVREQVEHFCIEVQNELFNLGGELASPQNTFVTAKSVQFVEDFIEFHNANLPPLREFVIPGQNWSSAQAHHARCVARRAERSVVGLHQEDRLSSNLLAYLNRLSDALFVVARLLGRINSLNEPQWQRNTGN
ncbi:cob(I)yrinic acid a,c-diamide adenosyltransferase [Kangiella sediminilitoris]|uniref:Corrinoid adenosyltransferase n=1 Tax=Kangiella sediminilitoris TaxID=1144748 RepID=A0A1B3B9X7_9GAMM|nr:cob(I)yrinic acid a,c-diamide adenosyltransferase [Kangiella sediminilitoris]AOE49536.1 ATP/cobalamin adenosyltransferase [Kangiella sediminilitoris]